jgi:hypothetical protein
MESNLEYIKHGKHRMLKTLNMKEKQKTKKRKIRNYLLM